MVAGLFSSPYEGDFVELTSRFSARSFKNLDLLVSHYTGSEPVVTKHNIDFTDESVSTLWRPELGFARLGLAKKINPAETSWFEACLTLPLFLSGLINVLDIVIDSEYPLYLCGQIIRANRLIIQGDQNQLIVKDGGHKALYEFVKVELQNQQNAWVLSEKPELLLIQNKAVASYSKGGWFDFWQKERLSTQDNAGLREFSVALIEVFEALERSSSEYYSWVTNALFELVPIKSEQRSFDATSFLNCPRHIHMSYPLNLVTGYSSLIHECSHQYFHLLLWNTTLTKPDAPSAYSSLKKIERPLVLVLAGFHAYANIYLGLKLLVADERHLNNLKEELSFVKKHTRKLRDSIYATGVEHLTEGGMDIFTTLETSCEGIFCD